MSRFKHVAIIAWVCSVAIGTRYIFGSTKSFGELQYLEYVTPYVALSSLVQLGLLMSFAKEALRWLTGRSLSIVFLVGVLSVAPSTNPLLSLWWFLVLLTLAWSVATVASVLRVDRYKKTFFVSLIALGSVEALIAITQFSLQHSLGLSFLGEPSADAATLGVAKVLLNGEKLLRPFGTFPHSNVLGGLLVASFLALLSQYRGLSTRYPLLGQLLMGLHVLAAVFTYSRSTWICFAVILAFFAIKIGLTKLLPSILIALIALTLFGSATLGRFNLQLQEQQLDIRSTGISEARQMLTENPLGVGSRGFIPELLLRRTDLPVYYYQPPHNAALLIGVELGVVGLLLLIVLWLLALMRPQTVPALLTLGIIVALSAFDHYLVSLSQGLGILGLLTVLFTVLRRKPLLN